MNKIKEIASTSPNGAREQKTHGQMLYEHQCPTHLRVVPVGKARFAEAYDVTLVPNPVHHAPWRLLTVACRANWERYAEGHNFFSPEPK